MAAIRWTIGDVSPRGCEFLPLRREGRDSGAAADDRVSVDRISLDRACPLVGRVSDVLWRASDAILWERLGALIARLVGESSARGSLADELLVDVGQFDSVCRVRALKAGSHGLSELSMGGG
jgi:hypothetical protein